MVIKKFKAPTEKEAIDEELISCVLSTPSKVEEHMNECKIASAMDDIFEIFRRSNKYIDETMPWVLAKDETKKESLEQPASRAEKKFSFPIDFEEEVAPSRVANRNILVEKEREKEKEREIPKKVAELYPKKQVVVEKPKFKPTPVISPVYGILDKNYKKEIL